MARKRKKLALRRCWTTTRFGKSDEPTGDAVTASPAGFAVICHTTTLNRNQFSSLGLPVNTLPSASRPSYSPSRAQGLVLEV